MEIGVLGSLVVRVDGKSALPSAQKPRQVLALLVLNANRVVPIAALSRELWDDKPPQSAMTTLQTYVLHIRKILGKVLGMTSAQVGREILVTRPGGYMFRVEPGALDLHVYEQRLAEGRAALAVGDNHRAARLLCDALTLWRDPPLVDVQPGRLLEVQIRRLEESRLSALEQRIEADMRLGRHHDIVSELIELAAEHQLHETVHAQLMLTFHRCGRRSNALTVFRMLRRSLYEELGLEPSMKLERLHQAILSCDPVLDTPSDTGALLLLDRLAEGMVRSA
ncbi:DNA-binding SARP family transcriptional activator [Streptosporangium becharense]|uniref:DNA-binding SARP family transcriptional activator n=1 Tax=Streptosporangium becharense TaxID=1816182 RepID=A0A7W9IM26_9ACTN|nr:AfsR/SARP family transcriptional regulator [Streptosporangium becharense]MBB2910429.1 DNA-binding SARP family transcriptional activator [Streptosporangium becharense]MBB5823172.1 DNA-binding SARP family transcriptional activator [Streptosporangium becharense]